MLVCVCVCLSACLSVYTISQNNCSVHLKLKHIAVHVSGNSSDEFDTGHCPIKVKVIAQL